MRPKIISSLVVHSAMAATKHTRGEIETRRSCSSVPVTEQPRVQELTADLDSAESGDPAASHALVVSLEFVRPLVPAEAAGARMLGTRQPTAAGKDTRQVSLATHPNSRGDAAPSTTWSLIEMMPDGSLPRLKSCRRVAQHDGRAGREKGPMERWGALTKFVSQGAGKRGRSTGQSSYLHGLEVVQTLRGEDKVALVPFLHDFANRATTGAASSTAGLLDQPSLAERLLRLRIPSLQEGAHRRAVSSPRGSLETLCHAACSELSGLLTPGGVGLARVAARESRPELCARCRPGSRGTRRA